MTIQVTITNNESPTGRWLEVIEQPVPREGSVGRRISRDIEPGMTAVFHVHLMKELTIREKEPESYSVSKP